MADPSNILRNKLRDKFQDVKSSSSSTTTTTVPNGNKTNLSILAQFDEMLRMTQPPLLTLEEFDSIINLIGNFEKYRQLLKKSIEEHKEKDLHIQKLETDHKQLKSRWECVKRAYARQSKEKDMIQKSYDNLKKRMNLLKQMIIELDSNQTNAKSVRFMEQSKDLGKSTTSLISLIEQMDAEINNNNNNHNHNNLNTTFDLVGIVEESNESDDGLLFDKSDDNIDSDKFKGSRSPKPTAPPIENNNNMNRTLLSDNKIIESNIVPNLVIDTIIEASNEHDASGDSPSEMNLGFRIDKDDDDNNDNKQDEPMPEKNDYDKNENIEKIDGPFSTKPTMRSISATPRKPLCRFPSTVNPLIMLRNAQAIPLDAQRLDDRKHRFVEKKAFRTVTCSVCNKNVGLCVAYSVCIDCHGVCHNRCRDHLPKPCLPYLTTNPSVKKMISLTGDNRKTGGKFLIIGDFVPDNIRPLVPPILIHCCNEIDRRIRVVSQSAQNLSDDHSLIGLYRMSSTDQEVRDLRRKMLKSNNGIPNLATIASIHTICGVVKMFLRDLDDSIISRVMWDYFYRAAVNLFEPSSSESESNGYTSSTNSNESTTSLKRLDSLKLVICQLPLPNRDSLAFLMLHLNNVAKAESLTKMNRSSLSKIFAPTIIGSSEFRQLLNEAAQKEISKQILILQALFEVEESFWRGILTEPKFSPFKDKPNENYDEQSLISDERFQCINSNSKRLLDNNDDDDEVTIINKNNCRSEIRMKSSAAQLYTPKMKRSSIERNVKDVLY